MGELAKLRPDVPSFGYAVVLSINATSIWGGIYPYLPAWCQTELVTIAYYCIQMLVFALSFAGWSAWAWVVPSVALRNGVLPLAVPLACGPLFLVAAMYVEPLALWFVFLAAALVGCGLAGFMVRWQRLFAAMGSAEGNLALIKGTMYSAGLYLCICMIPQALTAFILPLVMVPLAAQCLWLAGRSAPLDQPMFEDEPRQHEAVYRNALRKSLSPALAVGALGFCAGAVRFIAITHQDLISAINVFSMVALLAVVFAFYLLWSRRTLRISLTWVFSVLFPVMAVCLTVMPFVGAAFVNMGFGLANGCFMLACMFMMIHCGQLSRDNGINPIVIYGFYGAMAYLPQIPGYLAGYASGIEDHWGVGQFSFVSLVSLFVLLLAAVFGLKAAMRSGMPAGGSLELITLAEGEAAPTAVTDQAERDASVVDLLAERCRRVGEEFRLSSREVEVMELVARGYTGPAIAEMLFISENTMRTHNKRIYTKLDIHKKAELLALIDSY